ncbi:uncharacterized protein CDV56_103896 [Aspergillus thermomutatus]|uniref:Uncharacterized protein n=1 Tax=Aspergillus thermomutatus TaxID=41047 RepID=A0A397G1E8_ASPTH|nr:uncharacterized protein CDV56_103896 [Aspergillus thermomutatus]RHZ44852.1 hypothetical protein CDV56_103896 [Aspergillus thermomutatus]
MMRQPMSYRVAGLEGSEDNPILIDFEDVSLSEEETEICTSQQSFDGSPENPICILDEVTVCEIPESQTEDNAAVRCPHSSLLDPVGTPKENMEDPQSEGECGVSMQCSLVQMQGTITTTFDTSELPVYYFDESRLCESPERDWQGPTPVGSPHISTVNSISIPEGSVELEPQRHHGIVMDSALAQTESAAGAASGSSELLIQEPEVPALVDVEVQTETPLREERRYMHASTQTTPHGMAAQSENGTLKGSKADNNPRKRKHESASPESVPRYLPEITKHSIAIYDDLTPVERSVLAHMRTGKIGLNHYLLTINRAGDPLCLF